MTTKAASPLCSTVIQELNDLFNSLQKPYALGEIVRFNPAYQRLYPQMSRTEKLCAEKLVDALLMDLEDKKLASKIYGVV